MADPQPAAVPAVQRIGDAILLQGSAVLDVADLVAVGVRQGLARDGIAAPAKYHQLALILATVAADIRASSAPACANARGIADPSQVPAASVAPDEWVVGTAAAADLMGMTQSGVRLTVSEHRLAARRVGSTGKGYMFRRDDIDKFNEKKRRKQ